jgi:hypothetical protein
MVKKWYLVILLLLVTLIVCSPISAHSYSVAYTRIDVSASQTTLEFAIDDLSIIECIDGVDTNGDYILDANELLQGLAAVEKWLDQPFPHMPGWIGCDF